MSHVPDLVRGVLQFLDARGVGRYLPAGSGERFAVGDVALVAMALPQAPDRACALAPYTVDAHTSLSEQIDGLQFTWRGGRDDWADVQTLADAAFDHLHGLRNLRLPSGVWVEQLTFTSGVPAGLDDNGRWELIHNYYARTHRPSFNRT